jgi:hypothetical protein
MDNHPSFLLNLTPRTAEMLLLLPPKTEPFCPQHRHSPPQRLGASKDTESPLDDLCCFRCDRESSEPDSGHRGIMPLLNGQRCKLTASAAGASAMSLGSRSPL